MDSSQHGARDARRGGDGDRAELGACGTSATGRGGSFAFTEFVGGGCLWTFPGKRSKRLIVKSGRICGAERRIGSSCGRCGGDFVFLESCTVHVLVVEVKICAVGGESRICEGCGYNRSATQALRDSGDWEGSAGQRGQLVIWNRVSQVLG